MQRTEVESSQIESIGYDESTRTLEIEFTRRGKAPTGDNPDQEKPTGPVYQYENVPPETAKGFMEAESKGRYFGQNIKGVFKFTKVQD